MAWVAEAALDDGLAERLELCDAPLVPVVNTTVARQGRPAAQRRARPTSQIDPDTFAVRIDGELVIEQPATVLPMAQRYFLF